MNLNSKQVMAIVCAVLGVLTISTAQLTDLFGPGIAKTIVSCSGLANTIMSSVIAILSGQGQMVLDVKAMKGVEHIEVNEKANQTLARLAIDPTEDKIAPTPRAIEAVTRTAEGTSS